jgi:UrcA family protein
MTKFTHSAFRGLAVAAVLAAGLAGAAPHIAFAQSPTDETVQVSADVSTEAGVQQLLHRIRMASVKVCADQGSGPVYGTDGYFGCVRRTTADAVARADNPRLTALYKGEAGAVVLAKSR